METTASAEILLYLDDGRLLRYGANDGCMEGNAGVLLDNSALIRKSVCMEKRWRVPDYFSVALGSGAQFCLFITSRRLLSPSTLFSLKMQANRQKQFTTGY